MSDEILHVLDRQEILTWGKLVLGVWARLKGPHVKAHVLVPVPIRDAQFVWDLESPDCDIVYRLSVVSPAGRRWYERRFPSNRSILGPQERDSILPWILETGRLWHRDSGEAELRPLSKDEGTAWDFRMSTEESPDGAEWEVKGVLVRGEERMAPDDPKRAPRAVQPHRLRGRREVDEAPLSGGKAEALEIAVGIDPEDDLGGLEAGRQVVLAGEVLEGPRVGIEDARGAESLTPEEAPDHRLPGFTVPPARLVALRHLPPLPFPGMLLGLPLLFLSSRPFPEHLPQDAARRPKGLAGVKDQLPLPVIEAHHAGAAYGMADVLLPDGRPRPGEELDRSLHFDLSSARLRQKGQPPPPGQTDGQRGPGQAQHLFQRHGGLIVDCRLLRSHSGGNLVLVPGAGPGRLAALSAVEFTLGPVASIAFRFSKEVVAETPVMLSASLCRICAEIRHGPLIFSV